MPPPPPPLPMPSREEVRKLEAQQSLEMLYALRSHTQLPALESIAEVHEKKRWKFKHPEAVQHQTRKRHWKAAVGATRMGLKQMSFSGKQLKAAGRRSSLAKRRKNRRGSAGAGQLPAHAASLLRAAAGGTRGGRGLLAGVGVSRG